MEIKYDSGNYRKHNDKNKELINKSLKECGAGRSIVIDNEDNIIAGNGIYEQAQKLGLKTKVVETDGSELVVVKRTDLATDDDKRKQLAVMDNSTSDSSEFDFELLNEDFEVETLEDWGINADFAIEEEEKEIIEDDVPEEVETRCKLGDIWQLGEHRLMCGDSTKVDDVEKLMNGEKADMVFTDPPYSVNYTKKAKEILKSKNYVEIKNDNMSVEQTSKEIWQPAFKNAQLVSNDTCSIYATMPQGGDQMMMMMMMNASWQVKHELIWVKEAPVFSMGRLDYDYKHEPIAYGWNKQHKFYGKGEFTKSVWEIPRTENKLHPTMKPVALIGNAIKNSTEKGQNVLDIFGGSGSTLIACEQLNRKCYMMELDEKYCDVIITRWENLTGKKAVLLNE